MTVNSTLAIDPSDRKFYLASPEPGAVERFDAAYAEIRAQRATEAREAVETRLLYLSESERKNVINPATNRVFTDGEIDVAVNNAIDRRIALTDVYFPVLDNPGGGTDGRIKISEDIEELAEGNFAEDAVKARLLTLGVEEADLDAAVSDVQQLARDIRDVPELRAALDSANASDGASNGWIHRGDVDKLMVERTQVPEPITSQTLSDSEQAQLDARIVRWQDADVLRADLEATPIDELNDIDRLALAAISVNDTGADDAATPSLSATIQPYVLNVVNGVAELDQLPCDLGSQQLIHLHVTGVLPSARTDAQTASSDHVDSLIEDAVSELFEDRFADRKGDSEADLALQRFNIDLESMVVENPAMADRLINQAAGHLDANSDRMTDVRRADDSRLSKINHSITGAIRGGAGLLGDGVRLAGDATGTAFNASIRASGELAEFVLENQPGPTGAALNVLGVGDLVDSTSDGVAEIVDTAIVFGSEYGANALENRAERLTNPLEHPLGLIPVIGSVAAVPENVTETAQSDRVLDHVGNVEAEGLEILESVDTSRLNPPDRQPLTDFLTEEQMADVRALFGDSVDYDEVTVIAGDPGLLDVSGGRPFVPGNSTIVLNGLDPNAQWSEFMHEMVHVWQSQSAGNNYIPEAQYAQELGQGYNVAAAFADGHAGWSDLNPEQQAELVVVAVETGFIDDPGMQVYIRSTDENGRGGLNASFEAEAVPITDTTTINTRESDDDWINVTPTLVQGLDELHS